ncbi:MAG: endonuclease MutS2, partial [Armatimonadetes bacterium]|nr:endonuclease MutS2 [Armatimonadota bacterium]
ALRAEIQEALYVVLDRAIQAGRARERIIVQRQGRYCIPVRASDQAHVPGIVHDRSDSGATVFIEPQPVVERGNALRQIELDIDEEIRRILRELSALVGGLADALAADQRTLGVLDFIVARARLAGLMGATHPRVRGDLAFDLRAARHPLIEQGCVPNDIHVGEDFTTMVITGPNTGGKTVALKTAGLLALMAQSGLHIPADAGSEVAVFEHIFADIGDEQSIEQSLSTFSSHMSQIVRIVQRISAHRRRVEREGGGPVRALVLVDEIGAGTDPTEGAALAQAILRELHQAGCITIATTHYNALKAFAHSTDGVENASVEFDVKTLQPTYRLHIGLPGSSNAIEIARRLGLPRRVTAAAAGYLDEDELALEELIRQMDGSRRALDRQRGEMTRTQRDLEQLQREHAERLAQLERQRDEALEEGFEEALRIVREAEEEARAIIAELQRQPRQSKITEEGRARLARMRERTERRLAEQRRRPAESERQLERLHTPDEEPPDAAVELHAGDLVHVPSVGRDGTVARVLDDGRVQVRVGAMTIEARASELQPPRDPPAEEARELARRMGTAKALSFDEEIDVRGMTADEAIGALEKYLDDAMLAGATHVRIIHGKGTGALREAVHEFLHGHRYVSSYHLADLSEGGAGATEVRL